MPFWKRQSRKSENPVGLSPELAIRLAEIEKRLAQLLEELPRGDSVVLIEHADKVIVEKLEYSNHIGTLDIDNLHGQLNIGRNHQGAIPPDKFLSLAKKASVLQQDGKPEASTYAASPDAAASPGPKCNIHSRGKGK